MEGKKAEARKRGFKTIMEYAKYRCSMKRILRKNNVWFDKDITTPKLESMVKEYE